MRLMNSESAQLPTRKMTKVVMVIRVFSEFLLKRMIVSLLASAELQPKGKQWLVIDGGRLSFGCQHLKTVYT
jgi:hypothetical protein